MPFNFKKPWFLHPRLSQFVIYLIMVVIVTVFYQVTVVRGAYALQNSQHCQPLTSGLRMNDDLLSLLSGKLRKLPDAKTLQGA